MTERFARQPRSAGTQRRRRLGGRPRTLLAAIIAAICCWALPAAPALAVSTGTVDGTFSIPAGSGSPANVEVLLLDPSGNEEADSDATQTSSTTGSYSLTVAPGTYYVYLLDDHSGDNVAPDYAGDGGSDTIQSATQITVTAGNTTAVGKIALQSGATISGTVTDANRGSEDSADVYARRIISGADPDPVFDDGGPEATVSLTNGTWSLSGLPPGTYELEYYTYGSLSSGDSFDLDWLEVVNGTVSYDYGNETQYAVTAGSHTVANFSVPALAIINGTVSGPQGPQYNDDVWADDTLGDDAVDASTEPNGSYYLVVLPGTYEVGAEGSAPEALAETWYGGATEWTKATQLNIAAGATIGNINIVLGGGGTVSGTVVTAQGGAPVSDTDVEVVDQYGEEISEPTYTLPNGTYVIPDVPAGTWYVVFWGDEAANGSWYGTSYYGGSLSLFGATPITVTSGQTTANVNGFLLPASTSALGMPTTSGAALSGLHDNKVALRFGLKAGSGAGYLKSLTIGLPKGFSWNTKKLAADLSLGTGVSFTDAASGGKLLITLASGMPSLQVSLKAGGITVTKAIEKAAGGTTIKTKSKKKKKGKKLATAAKAKKKKRTKKGKDTIASETISLSVSDTTGATTSVPITIKKPH